MINAAQPGRSKRAEEVASVLRQEIERGRFRENPALPGERQLAELLHVSRTTLRRALADLIAEGILVQRHGMGTFVASDRGRSGPPPRLSQWSTLPGLSAISGSRELSRGISRPTPDEAMMLAVGPAETILRLFRILLVEGEPAALERACAPARLLEGADFAGSDLIEALASRSIYPVRLIQRVRTCLPGRLEADQLGMKPESLAVSIHNLFLLGDGPRCALVHALVRPDRLDAVFETSLPTDVPEQS